MLPVQAGYHWYSSMKIIVVFIFLHSRSVFQKTDSALYHVNASLMLVEHIKLSLTFSVLVDCTKLGRYAQHRELSTPQNEVGKQKTLGFVLL